MIRALTLLLSFGLLTCCDAADKKPAKTAALPKLDDAATAASKGQQWAEWVEPDFPFFSSVLDAREAGEGFPKDNLTPRGLILNLGHNLWACFDTDLLRIACIWQGEEGKPPVTPEALAPGSYHIAGQKTKDGQDYLPKPVGTAWFANDIYAGWQVIKNADDKGSLSDPREPAPSQEEVGRGALNAEMGVFVSVEPTSKGAVFTYYAGDRLVREWARAVPTGNTFCVMREIVVAPGTDTVLFRPGTSYGQGAPLAFIFSTKDSKRIHKIHPGEGPSPHPDYSIAFDAAGEDTRLTVLQEGPKFGKPEKEDRNHPIPNHATAAAARWPQTLTTKATLADKKGASYVLDDIPLPLDNPWKRNMRLADIAFLDDKGNAAAVSFDGDVWLLSGLTGDLTDVKWKRFASGLHEPMSIVVRKETFKSPAEEARSKSSAIHFEQVGLESRLAGLELILKRPRRMNCGMEYKDLLEGETRLAALKKKGKEIDEIKQLEGHIAHMRKAVVALESEGMAYTKVLLEAYETKLRLAALKSEEQSVVLENASLFVFDRNGVWRLKDTNNDGEADVYEMFCNQFGQTAETREFPNSMKLAPDGSLVISKGGQEGTTFGKDNGKVLRISADGKTVTPLGYGLRQPFIGVHPKTGLVTASDQQGNYVPSTPIHIIRDNQFYGHLPTIAPKEQYPASVAEPATWVPHPVNPSGVTQTWLVDAKMGPLNDECIHVGYNRPELFRVLFNERFKRPQATITSFWRDFDFPPLNAIVNPADGQLYVTGFQVWGTTAKRISGLARIRHTGEPRVLLKECTPTDKGLLLRFTHPLDAKLATDPTSYSAERWNYKRTSEYGSPHLKLDGATGQEWMNASSAYLSKDGKTVLVGMPDMKAGVHQMRIGWGLKSADGHKAENTAYFTPWELMTFDAAKEGFDDIKVDLTPRQVVAATAVKPTAEEGERLYQMIGCMACHSIDGTTVGKVGPSWKGLFGSVREIAKGKVGKVNANEVYLKESIVDPSAQVVKGFEKFDAGMPIYAGILNESQIESLILYIKKLK